MDLIKNVIYVSATVVSLYLLGVFAFLLILPVAFLSLLSDKTTG